MRGGRQTLASTAVIVMWFSRLRMRRNKPTDPEWADRGVSVRVRSYSSRCDLDCDPVGGVVQVPPWVPTRDEAPCVNTLHASRCGGQLGVASAAATHLHNPLGETSTCSVRKCLRPCWQPFSRSPR